MNTVDSDRVLGYAALALVIIGNTTGNLLLKLGASASSSQRLFGVVGWLTLAGVMSFAVGILAYAWALKHIELHSAQIVISVQYVAVVLLAAFMLGERISLTQWCGMALIAMGIFICTR